jgi:hypothetical protein
MAMRVKNVAAGFYNATGFHPIRSSADYDPDRAGDEYSQRSAPKPRRGKSGKRAAGRKAKPRARKHVRRKASPMPAPGFSPGAYQAPRTRNPIPVKWATAKVRKVGNDIQVMLFPKGKVAKRGKARRVVRRRNPQAGITQFSARARCWGTLKTNKFRVESDGTVWAWDSVAGHYTIHHGMTKREESRIRSMARRRR